MVLLRQHFKFTFIKINYKINKAKNIVALSIAILFSGCAAQVVSSGKLAETTNSLNKINIVFSQTHLSADDGDKSPYTERIIQEESAKFCEKVLKVVPDLFNKNGISSLSGKIENGEILDHKKLDNLFSENQSNTPLLVILPIKAKVYFTSYCVTEFSVKTSLYEVKQGDLGKPLWNATIDLPTPFRVFTSLDNSVAEKLANTALERVKSDG